MQTDIKKTNSEHEIIVTYKNLNLDEYKVTVKLIINYKTRRFDILPINGKNEFVFKGAAHHFYWVAITEAIRKASEFAAEKLGIVKNNIDAKE